MFSQKHLKAHLANSPIAIIEFDASFTVIRWSGAAERMFGWKSREIIGKKMDAMHWVHEEDRASVSKLSNDMLTGTRPRSFNFNRNYTRNGSIIYCEWYSSAVYDTQGKLESVLSQVLDVTDRTRAEQALREKERRFRALLSASSEALYHMSPDWSEMYHLYSGDLRVSAEKPDRDWFYKYIHPDDQAVASAAIQKAIRNKSVYRLEHRVRRPDGTWGWTFSRAVPIKDEDGEIIEWFGTISDISKRKAYEAELKKYGERFGMAAKAAKVGTYSRNLQTGEDYWSPEFLSIFGHGPDVGLPLKDGIPAAIHPDDFTNVLEEARDRFHRISTPEFNTEHRIILPDGRIRWVMVRGRTDFDEKGNPLQTVGLVMDITDRKHTEEALHQNKQSLARELQYARSIQEISTKMIQADSIQTLYEQILDTAIEVLNADFASIQILHPDKRNGEKLQLIGYRGFNEKAAKYWEWVSPSSQSACGAVLKTGKRFVVPDVFTCEFMAGSEDLEIYTQTGIRAVQSTPLFSRSGTLLGMLSTHWKKPHDPSKGELRTLDVLARQAADLMDRIKAEEALKTEQVRLQTIIRNLPEGIMIADALSGKIVLASDQVKTIFRQDALPVKTIAGYKKVYHPDGREYRADEWPLARTITNGEIVQNEEVKIMRGDKSYGWISVSSAPITDQQGKVATGVVIFSDITERKRSQQELQQARDELKIRVKERTEELEKRATQLARLSSELTLSEQRERDRIAEVLHDHLQQLIVGAKIGQEMLISDLDDVARPKADRVLDLITQSLRTSRSLSTELSPNVLRTGNLTDSLKWLARWMLETHGLEVKLKINQKIVLKRKDIIILLFQSIRELLLNTLKHSGIKSATVSTKIVNGDLLIMVSDEGKGFDPKRVQKKKYSSSQFGLFSIEERLQHLGGKVDVESSPNAGTDISITVPIQEKISTKEQLPLFNRIEKRKIDRAIKPEKISILLVDDHRVMRDGLANLLDLHADIEVLGQASDGEEAVNLARELLPDVILMDVNMPKMDGIEATRAITSEFPHIRIIGLSMYDEDDKAAEMIEAGASAYRSKSGNTDLLLSSIRGQ
ncbi:MAG: PAS domain S-box protein [Desulfobacterales bacterium]